jgi:transposase
MYRIRLTTDQRTELNRRAHEKDIVPSTRDRLEMVRLSDAGFSVPKIARHLGQHEQTVRAWIKAFLTNGFDALINQPRGGKQSAFTEAIQEAVRTEIAKGERTWTAGQIADWLAQQHGVRLSVGRMRKHLRRARLSWQRTSRSLKHKQKPEEVAAKQADLQTLEKGAMPLC